MNKKNNRKGFTTVELVIVIAVIAILAAVLIPTFSNLVKKANESAAIQTATAARTAILNNALMPDKDDYVIKDNETVYIVVGEGTDADYFSMTIKSNKPAEVKENKPNTADTEAFEDISGDIEDLPEGVKVYVAIPDADNNDNDNGGEGQ